MNREQRRKIAKSKHLSEQQVMDLEALQWLSRYLNEHPDIIDPDPQELASEYSKIFKDKYVIAS
jgi:hypothetical protein